MKKGEIEFANIFVAQGRNVKFSEMSDDERREAAEYLLRQAMEAFGFAPECDNQQKK